ncbi:hypothetical protein [uncultured Roseovarius sp.]|uniref:hypothetical protein n=1 Tax=uncultured Roseovarius sp. TaxID=293344 RepID=UPI0026104EF6|nr:hypothetical protein [uncultured Roseovarius sp.]
MNNACHLGKIYLLRWIAQSAIAGWMKLKKPRAQLRSVLRPFQGRPLQTQYQTSIQLPARIKNGTFQRYKIDHATVSPPLATDPLDRANTSNSLDKSSTFPARDDIERQIADQRFCTFSTILRASLKCVLGTSSFASPIVDKAPTCAMLMRLSVFFEM